MADNRNFAALDWLIHEIGETLKEARQALEAYVENPKDSVRIRFCLTHIHQVHGSLQMVEFFGAAMLAEEMERLTQAMIQGSVANAGEAQEVLMRAILQFPAYLDQVKATRKDNPLVVLPLLNDLRAVRGESLLTDTKLFVPNLAPAKKVTGTRSPAAQDNVQFQAMALKLRQMYQYAAAGFIRNVNSDENLAYLQKVFSRLHKLTQGTARHALWDICMALAEALEIDALEISVAVKNLLRQLDKEIKILAVHGTKALNSYTNDELIKNLLYYVARAGKHAPGFIPNSHLQRIYETYHLDEALIEGKETGDDSVNMLSTPDPEAMRSVVEALKTELDIIKHALDVCLSGGDTQAALSEALPVVKRIADTMAVLGLGDLRKQVLEQGAALEMVASSSDYHLSNEQLMSIAGKVIEIEDALDGLAQLQSMPAAQSHQNEGDITLTRAKESVLRESRNGLEHAKDAIIEYIASQWDRVHLQNVPDTLREIRGGLDIMPLPRAARILGACARYIEEQLLAQDFTPQWASLDTLADAITSVEYYLERLSGGGSKEENELLLSVAEESLANLGYAVAKVSRGDLATAEQEIRRNKPHSLQMTEAAVEADEANLSAAYEQALQPEVESSPDLVVPDRTETTPSESAPAKTAPQFEPGNLLNNLAPTIGNTYPRPATTILVAPTMGQPVGIGFGSVPAKSASASAEIVPAVVPSTLSETLVESAASELEPAALGESLDAVEDAQPAEEQPQIAASVPVSAADEDSDIDEEIIEIFVEEAGEVSEAIAEYFPRWAKNFDDQDSLTEFRRAFHTLKGSGRMVGAHDIGELAWSIENMLNRVLDRTITPATPHVNIIERVRSLLPGMIAAFSRHAPNPYPEQALHYRSLAESLARGEVPAELLVSGDQAMAAAKPELLDNEELSIALPEAELENEALPVVELEDEADLHLDASVEGAEPETFPVNFAEPEAAVVEPVAELSELVLEDDDSEGEDAQLWDIFGAEALAHLQVVQDFIAHMEAEAPVYEPPSDSIQRALHTLKGSAHMAEITRIADLAAPLEKFVKELRSYQVVINEDILQLLRDAVSYTQLGLSQIERGESVDIPRLQQFVARVHELREIHVAPLVRQQELDENGKRPVDPELLSIFMAEEMNLLLDADKIIAQWQHHPYNYAILQPVVGELRNLTRGAHHAHLPPMADLGEKLEQVYTAIAAGKLGCEPVICDNLNAAHIALLDMVDAIAAGQNLAGVPPQVAESLDDLLARAASYQSSTWIDDAADTDAANESEIALDEAAQDEVLNLSEEPTGEDELILDLDLADEVLEDEALENTALDAIALDDEAPLLEAIYRDSLAQVSETAEVSELTLDDEFLNAAEEETPTLELDAIDLQDTSDLDGDDISFASAADTYLTDIATLTDTAANDAEAESSSLELVDYSEVVDYPEVEELTLDSNDLEQLVSSESLPLSESQSTDANLSEQELDAIQTLDEEIDTTALGWEDEDLGAAAAGIEIVPDEAALAESGSADDYDQLLDFVDESLGEDTELNEALATDDALALVEQGYVDQPVHTNALVVDEIVLEPVSEHAGETSVTEQVFTLDLDDGSDEILDLDAEELTISAAEHTTYTLGDDLELIDEDLELGESLTVAEDIPELSEDLLELSDFLPELTDAVSDEAELEIADDEMIYDLEASLVDDELISDEPELMASATGEADLDEVEPEMAVVPVAPPVAAPKVEAKAKPAPKIIIQVDEDFDPEIVEIFIEEALELLEDIDRALHDWQEDWNNANCVEELKRCLHTFKGGARLAGLTSLGDLSHNFETQLIEMDDNADLDQNFFRQLNTYQDQLHSGVNQARSALNDGGFVSGAELEGLDTSDEAAELVEDTIPVLVSEPLPELPTPEVGVLFEARPTLVVDNTMALPAVSGSATSKPNVLTFAPKPKPPAAPLPKIPGAEFGGGIAGAPGSAQVQHLAARRAGPQEVVKVSAELLEELVNLAGETSISRSRMEQQVSDLGGAIEEMDSTIHRLQEQLRRLDIETEAQVLFRQEQMMQHEEFDPLEMDRYSQLQQLSRSLIESASDLMDLKYTLADKTRDTETLLLQQSRINTDLQEGLMRSRMVPFSRLVPRLRRIVRQAATELGKEVDFELDNVEGELDRTVLERMVAPLEHMLRNAVDHGIESPEARAAAGKPAMGRIMLSLGREGGDVLLRLADDGRGINLQRVREKAIERGLMAEDAPLSDQDLMQFILHAGFSTADKVTQISGRGVGMDVVHSEIKQLGGAMFIDSRWGEGTEFTIRLPFTVSVNRALMVQIGDDLYAIPLNSIEGIVRVSPFELEHYYQDPEARFDYAGENYLVRYLGTLLDSEALPKLDGQSLPLPVILVRSTENTVALQVDRLLGSREIVVKTLGAQFSAVRGVSGATVMGDGSVVVILDLHALIREQLALGLNHAILLDNLMPVPVEEEQGEKVVMVVDDSVTVRKVTSRFLEREGFRVISAKDGVEALQLLQDHIPDVMLLDIEMPRMDGFEVAKNVRTSSRLRDIPIIMITSRTGEKHRERAFELGVNKYMGKPYQEDLLLANIKELIKKPVS